MIQTVRVIPGAPTQPGSAIGAIVFDMDGVLVLSATSHRQAFVEVLGPMGVQNFDYSRFAGWRTPEVFRFVLSEAGLAATEATISEASDRKSRRAREILAAADPLPDKCVEVLLELANAGFKLALASSGSPASIAAFLDVTGTRPLFRSVLTGADVTEAKPNPEIYTRTFQQLGLHPQECLVVEDAVSGVLAARAAGAQAVGIAGTCACGELRDAGAVDVLDSLAVFPEWLRQQGIQPPAGNNS